MKRRDFLTVCGAGVAAGYTNTGSAEGAEVGGGQFESPGANAQRVVLRAVGLNALFVTSHDGTDKYVDIVGIDSNGIELPDKSKMHSHSPLLVIATANLVNEEGGTEATVDDRLKWKLRTSTTAFRFWDLSKKTLSIENVTGPSLGVGVYGAVPLKKLNSDLTTANWRMKGVASAKLRLDKGLITDDVSRKYLSGAHRRRWQFTAGEFDPEGQSVFMTDTIRIELNATIASPVAFKIGGLSIATKGQWVEAYLVTLPHKLTNYETVNYLKLHHITAAYQLFDDPPKKPILPVSDTGGGGEEPVFCPPALFTEAS